MLGTLYQGCGVDSPQPPGAQQPRNLPNLPKFDKFAKILTTTPPTEAQYARKTIL
jgi:hypothetical protein